MADEEDKQEETVDAGDGSSKEKKEKKSLLPWILLGIIVPLFAGAGFGLGRLVAGSKESEPETLVKEDVPEYMKMLDEAKKGEKTWFYQDIEPVVSNLNDPGATRFVRAGLMLELSGTFDEVTGKEYLTANQPKIKNWLAIYLASQRVEDLQGERNLKRILAEVRDMLNERLFPNAKPPITSVLLSELAIQ